MSTEFDGQTAGYTPDYFPVTVVMQRRPAQVSAWVDYVWTAIGITAGESHNSDDRPRIMQPEEDTLLQFYSGYRVHLHVDECDSYYHNLMSPAPRCYVVVRQEEDADRPEPFMVCLSFDEAHAYLEGDDVVHAVDIPPELYRWTESFVLAHYCPQRIRKRKRKNWREPEAERNTA